ncbi:MAG TPA: hypothetical protein VLB44_11580 [Kofleriaceae bacterium]|nr:hypothetical protein [Kofleriaceae bacterium]
MRAVSYLIATAALILNPMAACEPQVHYDYGPAEIQAALAGRWTATVGTQTVTFEVDFGKAERHSSRGLVKSAAACSHRRWVSAAEACGDVTTVELKLVAIEGAAPTDAQFMIGSTHFDSGHLSMHIDGAYVSAEIRANGTIEQTYGAQIVHTL